MGAKGASKVYLVALGKECAAVKSSVLSSPKLFLYPGFYERGPHCNDPDPTLCSMHCILRSSGDEASARSLYPGANLNFLPRVALHNFNNSNHTQFLVCFQLTKPSMNGDSSFLLTTALQLSALKPLLLHPQAWKTSQRSREGQTTSPWLSSRAY